MNVTNELVVLNLVGTLSYLLIATDCFWAFRHCMDMSMDFSIIHSSLKVPQLSSKICPETKALIAKTKNYAQH